MINKLVSKQVGAQDIINLSIFFNNVFSTTLCDNPSVSSGVDLINLVRKRNVSTERETNEFEARVVSFNKCAQTERANTKLKRVN
jgi:hypothetical protein